MCIILYIYNYNHYTECYVYLQQFGGMGRGGGGFRGGRGGGGGGRGGFSPGGPGRGMGRGGGGFDGGNYEDHTTFAVPADKCGLVIGKGQLL